MLTETFFTNEDLEKFRTAYRRSNKMIIIMFTVEILIVSIIWMVMSKEKRINPWLYLAVGLGIPIILIGSLFLSTNKRKKKDMGEQVKLRGELRVSSKLTKKNEYRIYFDSDELKVIYTAKKVFDKITENDVLNIEVSKHSQHLFKLERAGENLLA